MRRTVVVGRRGPGLVGTMARTAVVAGTATVVAKGVSGSMDQKAAQQQSAAQQQQAAAQQQQQAAYDAGYQQAQMQAQQETLAQQQEALAQQQQQLLAAQAAAAQPPAPQAAPPSTATPGAITDDTMAQLQRLAEMQKQGILSPEEFAQQKARLLGS